MTGSDATPRSTDAPAFRYDVCGLRLRSDVEIPGLATATGEANADVRVIRGSVDAPARWPASGIAAWPSAEADVLSWAGRAALRVSAHAIVVDSHDDLFARQCVVGPGLGVALHRRSVLVLHGSAVDVGGRAVVLLGHKGAGKSTTAAALLARGHTLLTDDLVAIRTTDGGPHCAPGPTQMKLWPAAANALGLHGKVEPFADGLDKGVWHGARTAPHPVPVALLCSLSWGDAVALQRQDGSAAFRAVFEHAYAPRFLGPTAASPLLASCARLGDTVATASLARPQTLDSVGPVVDAIERALAHV